MDSLYLNVLVFLVWCFKLWMIKLQFKEIIYVTNSIKYMS